MEEIRAIDHLLLAALDPHGAEPSNAWRSIVEKFRRQERIGRG